MKVLKTVAWRGMKEVGLMDDEKEPPSVGLTDLMMVVPTVGMKAVSLVSTKGRTVVG